MDCGKWESTVEGRINRPWKPIECEGLEEGFTDAEGSQKNVEESWGR